MAAVDPSGIQVSVHLDQHSSVSFNATNLWPGDQAADAASLAAVLARRLTGDGFVGFTSGAGSITLIPTGAVKRVDVSAVPKRAGSR
jgi:hypothetical protein